MLFSNENFFVLIKATNLEYSIKMSRGFFILSYLKKKLVQVVLDCHFNYKILFIYLSVEKLKCSLEIRN